MQLRLTLAIAAMSIGGDPAHRSADVENVEIVFKDGVGYDPAKLNAPVRGMAGIR